MKNLLLILMLVACGLQANAQRTVVKVSPIKSILRTPTMSVEHAITERISVNLHGRYSFFNKGDVNEDAGQISLRGFGFTPEVRFYLIKKQTAPSGLYAGPYATTNFYKIKYQVQNENGYGAGKVKASIFATGGMIGYQAVTKSGVTIDTFMGVGYNIASANNVKVSYADFEEQVPIGLSIAGVLPRFGFAVGYAF